MRCGFSILAATVFPWVSGVAAGAHGQRIHIVGHGWHTGLILPLDAIDADLYPAFKAFEGWERVEVGWGDEGFYRGGTSISLPVALKAVATPTETVLHVVGAASPVEEFFSRSEVVAIEIADDQFDALCRFVGETFKLKDGAPIDLGQGIYGDSRFFRAEGYYYFPRTCNVWTLQALEAAGLPVIPAAGIRTENVITQSARHGNVIRRFPGRSRLSVLVAVAVAALAVGLLRKTKGLTWWTWAALLLAVVGLAAVTMAQVNHVAVPKWLPGFSAWTCWMALACVAGAHLVTARKRFRWRHVLGAIVAILAVGIGLSPL